MDFKLRSRTAIQLLVAIMFYVSLIWIAAAIIIVVSGEEVSDSPVFIIGCVHIVELLSLTVLVAALIRYPYAFIGFLVLQVMFLLALVIVITVASIWWDLLLCSPLVHLLLIWELVIALSLCLLAVSKMLRLLTGWSNLKNKSNSTAATPSEKTGAKAINHTLPIAHPKRDAKVGPTVRKAASKLIPTHADPAIQPEVIQVFSDPPQHMEVRSDPHHME